MADKKLYITKPGGVILHELDGQSQTYKYGQEVKLSEIKEEQHQHVPDYTSTKRPADAPPAVNEELTLDAAMQEAGQSMTTASAVPGNYETLSEDQAVRLVSSITNPGNQAQLVAHEMNNQNRERVINSADQGVLEKAEVYAVISDHALQGGSKKAKAEETDTTEDTPVAPVAQVSVNTPTPPSTSEKPDDE